MICSLNFIADFSFHFYNETISVHFSQKFRIEKQNKNSNHSKRSHSTAHVGVC